MKILQILLIACLHGISPASSASAPDLSTIPECARDCFTTAISNSPCGLDLECLCKDEAFGHEVLACVEKSCLPIQAFATQNATATACHYPRRDERRQFDILTDTLLILTSIVVGLRFFERLKFGPGLCADDYIVLFCLCVDIANSVVCTYGLSPNGLGKDAWTLEPDQITGFLRSLYVGQSLYACEVFAVKLCVLLFYLRIFPGVLVRRLIWGTFIFSVVSLIIFVTLALAQCQPVSFYWKGWDALHEGKCIGINALAWAIAIVSIVLDLWILGLPLSQIIYLQMHWKRKVAVASMFIIGTFVTVVSALRLRFLVAFGNSINPTRDGYATCYWSIIELNVAVCCVCMPNLRLLLLRVFPRLGGSSARQLSEAQYGTAASRRKNSRAPVSGDQSDNDLHPPAYYSSNPSIDRSSTTELVELEIRPTSKGMNVV